MSDYSRTDGAITASALKQGAVSMLHMRHAMTGGERADSPAMRWGRLVHGCVLEPETYFRDQCVVWADGRKAGKAWDEFSEAAGSREVVTLDELGRLQTIAAAVHGNPDAHRLIESTEHEVVRAWDSPSYGRAKCRVDGYSDRLGLVELKTCGSLRRFPGQCVTLGYDIQGGWYCNSTVNLYSTPVHFIAVEARQPHDVAVYRVPHDLLQCAGDRADKLAVQYRACERSGVFPGQSAGIAELVLPDWAGGDLDDSQED
jgi:hypothetical protein